MSASTSPMSDTTEEKRGKRKDEDEEQEIIKRAGLRTLFAFMTRKHLPVFSAAVISAVLAAFTYPAMAVLYGTIFRQFADFGSGKIDSANFLHNASKYASILCAVAALSWLLNSVAVSMFLTFGELQAKSARDRIFNALLEKDVEWYDTRENGIGAFLPGVQMQIRELQLSNSAPMSEGLQCGIAGLGALGVAFYFSWNLTLVIVCTVPLIYIVMAFLSRRLTKCAHEQADKLQQALKYVTNAIQSIETVKCFNGERFEIQKYASLIAQAGTLYKRQANLRSIQIGFMQFITFGIFVQGFWYGNYLVTHGKSNAGSVATTFWGALMAVQGITGFLPQLIVVQKGGVAGARLQILMRQISKSDDLSDILHGKRPGKCSGDVEFKQVLFAYPTRPDQLALRKSSLFFPAGETTFVIGRSGSGKSTLGQLLVRFYEPTAGEITVDGHPLQKLDVQWLRENVTLVEQHSVLFNDTIRRNIAFAKQDENITSQQVDDAVEFALLQQMIRDLPQGLDTLTGAKGNSLSGGQKQRVALARARLRDTAILVLDESTSALDYVTRSDMLEAIRKWRRGRTTIVITHDISQIEPNDFVYVMDKARVVQEGYRKTLEADKSSAFCTFLAGEGDGSDDAWDEATANAGDGTDEILSLHSEPWGVGSRPASAAFFEESFVSPLFAPTRTSRMIAASRRSSMIGTPEPGKFPPTAIGRATTASTPDAIPGTALASRRNSLVPTVDIHRRSLLSQDVPIRLDLPEYPSIRKTIKMKIEHRKSRRISAKLGSSPDIVRTLSIKHIISTLWPNLDSRTRFILIGAIASAMTHAAAVPVFAFVFARLLSTLYATSNQTHMAMIYAITILGIAVLDGLVSYGFYFLFDACAQVWANNLKKEALRRILLQPREFFDREENSVSRLAECLDHFAEEARNLPGRFAGIALVVVTMIFIAVVWSLVICWKLTLVALATGPVLYALTACYNATSSRWERFSNEADENVGQVLHETFVNIKTVRCLVLEEVFRQRYTEVTRAALKVGLKRAIYTGSIFGLNYSSIFFVAAFLFWYGAVIVAHRDFSTTDIIQVFGILLLSLNHVNFLGNYIPQVNIARDAGSRLIRLARLPTDSHEHKGDVQLLTAGDIALRHLTFTYPTRKDQTVLNDVSFSIQRGSCTAIVGSSGSGKSTIAALLLKLYQTSSDSHALSSTDLSISGKDVKALHTKTLRSKMAIVSQTPVLFPGTVAENIAYGLELSSPRATTENILLAAEAAGIAEFIDSLPQGYETVIGEGGTGLSGGQAQRIAIARALARNPDILILDEATSALDVESAGIIRETIQRLVADASGHIEKRSSHNTAVWGKQKDMTVIIITHAREMMAIAENIIMLDRGRVVAEGTFDALKRTRGPFASLLRGERSEVPERGI
ncbi:P-loop containing nucleoside triphosphate hydrolase protein [Lophiotrema nucula]|uniref:P-loop containing nucleoside triphosphate hydrolase protein n=1 Tax=Lophiotrema nucula TaxID=690887 RepID=A0A6A5YEM1_9PLEO|nr:P-loop containing nucleoside triphosphate hydrolase protein [Lophiotrema nucula]